MRFRQVHLDFHTSEAIPGIGEDFDKKEFQEALLSGHVDSITVFSKCHHGWAYHPTKANEMHPNLDFDLLGAQIEAAHEIGVKAPIYLSAGYDEKYAVRHPEDTVKERNGAPRNDRGFLTPVYHLLCFNTKYVDTLVEQVKEVCERYDPDGIFMDITSPQPCFCNNCIRRMREEGYDVNDDKSVMAFREKVYLEYAEKIREAVESVKPGTPIFHNAGATPRGKREIAGTSSHNEIESLPTSSWGYDNLPLIARYAQVLDKEYLGMTGKFHTSWGEFGGYKHKNALIYETALSVSLGGKCSVGDQLHPRGKADPETYRLIGAAYAEVEKREPWLDNVTPIADIALYSYEGFLASRPEKSARADAKLTDVGAMRLLCDGHYLFQVVDDQHDLTPYKVVVLPDNIELDAALTEKLRAYVAQGGKLLATGISAVGDDGEIAFALGATRLGEREIYPMYATPNTELADMGRAGYVIYERPTQRVKAAEGGVELASAAEPYFERTAEHFCSHRHAPQKPGADGAAVTLGPDGAYVAFPICFEYANIGSQFAKQMFCATLDRLLCGKKSIKTPTVPTQASVTLMDQKAENRLVAHVVYAPRNLKGNARKVEVIEDCLPIYGTEFEVKMNGKKATGVYSAPDGEELEFTQNGDVTSFTLPKFTIHGMAVIDYDAK